MKKIFALVLSFIISISMCVPVYASSSSGWNYGKKLNYSPSEDARTYKPSSWAKHLVDKYDIEWYENPTVACLRGEVMLVQLRVINEALLRQGYSELTSNISLSNFKDIAKVVSSAKPEIRVLKDYDILNANSKGYMNLDSVITRAEVARILTKTNEEILKMTAVNNKKSFSDVKSSYWASGYISYVYQIGLMDQVKNNKFYPDSGISIEQMLEVLDKEVGSYGITEDDISEAMNDTFKVTMCPNYIDSDDSCKVTSEYSSYNIVKSQEKTIQLYVEPYTSKNLEVVSYDKKVVKIVSIDQSNNTVTIRGVSNKVNDSVYIKAKIKGTSDEYATLIPIYVRKDSAEDVPVTSISIYDNVTLKKGQSCILTANVYPSNATNKNVSWYSDDKNIAKVDKNGRITAIGEGATVITAQTHNGYKSYCVVTVNSKDDSNVPKDERRNFMYASGYEESSYYNAFNDETIKFIVDTDKSISSITLANNNCILEKSATSHTNGWQFTIKTAKLSDKGECLVSVKLSDGEVLTVNVCIYP